MACNLHCPNCGEDLGKDTECSAMESCGNCGETDIFNQFGDTDDLTEEELSKFKSLLRKKRGY